MLIFNDSSTQADLHGCVVHIPSHHGLMRVVTITGQKRIAWAHSRHFSIFPHLNTTKGWKMLEDAGRCWKMIIEMGWNGRERDVFDRWRLNGRRHSGSGRSSIWPAIPRWFPQAPSNLLDWVAPSDAIWQIHENPGRCSHMFTTCCICMYLLWPRSVKLCWTLLAAALVDQAAVVAHPVNPISPHCLLAFHLWQRWRPAMSSRVEIVRAGLFCATEQK